jgi:rubrerythrin
VSFGLPLYHGKKLSDELRTHLESYHRYTAESFGLDFPNLLVVPEFLSLPPYLDFPVFFRNLGYTNKTASTTEEKESSIDEFIFRAYFVRPSRSNEGYIRAWLNKYRGYLSSQYYSQSERIKLLKKYHLDFVPREGLITNSLKEIEKGNFTVYETLLKTVKSQNSSAVSSTLSSEIGHKANCFLCAHK